MLKKALILIKILSFKPYIEKLVTNLSVYYMTILFYNEILLHFCCAALLMHTAVIVLINLYGKCIPEELFPILQSCVPEHGVPSYPMGNDPGLFFQQFHWRHSCPSLLHQSRSCQTHAYID